MSNARVHVESRLMVDYVAGSPVSYQHPVATASDSRGGVMFFSIGTDGHIHVTTQASGTPTGWTGVDLSEGLPATLKAINIATAEDEDGRPILAAVFQDHATNTSKVYFAKTFGEHAGAGRWVYRGASDTGSISNITTGHGKDGTVLIVVTTQAGEKSANFVINPDLKDTSWLWREVPAPINSKRVLHTAIGHQTTLQKVSEVQGLLYALHDLGNGESQLVLTSLPDFEFYNHVIPLKGSPQAFGLVDDAEGNAHLVIGNETLSYLPPEAQLTKDEKAVEKATVPLLQSPLAHAVDIIMLGLKSNKGLEAWCRTKDGRLLHTTTADGKQWEPVMGFQQEVGRIAAYRNAENTLTAVFTIDLDNNLAWYLQDPTTTRWKSHHILVETLDQTREVNVYRMFVRVTDEGDAPLADRAVRVNATELSEVTINHETYFIDLDRDQAVCHTDSTGTLTIVQKAHDLASPRLHLYVDGISGVVEVDPTADIRHRIAGASASDLAGARMQTDEDGVTKPLFPNKSADDLKGVHQAVQKLVKAGHTLPSGDPAPSSGVPSSFAVHPAGSLLTRPGLSTSHFPPQGWGLDLTGEHPVYTEDAPELDRVHRAAYNERARTSAAAVGGVLGGLERVFGDVWHAIKHGFLEVTHLTFEAVKDGIKIIVKTATESFHVIARYAEQVWDVITYVFKKVGAFFKELVLWLGFLFKWKDILRSHDVLRRMTNLGLDELIAKADRAEAFINSTFTHLEERVLGKDITKTLDKKATKPLGQAAAGHKSPFSSPESTWAIHHISRPNALRHGDAKVSGAPLSIPKDLEQHVATLKGAAGHFGESFAKGIKSSSPADVVKQILAVLEEAVLTAAKQVMLGLIDAAKATLGVVKDLLNKRWNVPVLTPLYEKIIAPGSKLTLLDLACLVAAIPGTVVYKAAVGHMPFDKSTHERIKHAKSYQELTQIFAGTSPAQAVASSEGGVREAAMPSGPLLSSAEADDDHPVPPVPRGFTYFFGFVAAACSLVYGVVNGLQVAASETRLALINKIGSAVKLVMGGIANVCSIVSMSIALGYATEYLPRLRYEEFVNVFQLVFNVKDGLMWKLENDDLIAFDVLLDGVETVLGLLNGVFFAALFIAEVVEDAWDDGWALVKLDQNWYLALSQILALPADLADDPRLKAIFAGGLVLVGTMFALLNGIRTGHDIAATEGHANF